MPVRIALPLVSRLTQLMLRKMVMRPDIGFKCKDPSFDILLSFVDGLLFDIQKCQRCNLSWSERKACTQVTLRGALRHHHFEVHPGVQTHNATLNERLCDHIKQPWCSTDDTVGPSISANCPTRSKSTLAIHKNIFSLWATNNEWHPPLFLHVPSLSFLFSFFFFSFFCAKKKTVRHTHSHKSQPKCDAQRASHGLTEPNRQGFGSCAA